MLHHRLLRTALAVTIAGSALSLGSLPAQAASFTDIGPSKFRQDIEWLAGAGITSGCGEGRFCPKGAVTRGQMASFLSRFLELPQPEKRDAYTDDDGSIHELNIDRLAASGITVGCGTGRFCPHGLVTRGQMATFLARALTLREGGASDFFDDDDLSKHRVNIDRLAASRITAGCATRRFCPDGIVTREQMAAFLHRAASLRQPAPMSGMTSLEPGSTVLLPAGWIVGRLYAEDFVGVTGTVEVVVRAPGRAAVDARARIGGLMHHRVSGDGSLAGSWVPTSGDLALRAGAPLPACETGDIRTRHDGYDDWQRTLLDLTYKVGSAYVPPDLVAATKAGVDYDRARGVPRVRQIVIKDLTAMAADAKAAGVHVRVNSAYRSYETQLAELAGDPAWFESAVRSKGYDEALLYTNRPGHSEHQMGTTLDIEPYVFPGAHAWLSKHAWKYGFLLSYANGKNTKHCYGTEIWHYRYYGREVAAQIRSSGLSPREWLWYVHHR